MILDSLGSNSFGNWHFCRARSLVLPCPRSLGSHCTARPVQRINASECYDLVCFSRIPILYIDSEPSTSPTTMCVAEVFLLVQLGPLDIKGSYIETLRKPLSTYIS